MFRNVPVPDSAILYRDASSSVALLDIPMSIALAQGTGGGFPLKRLMSCVPLQQPYHSNEPKSDAARAKLSQSNEEEIRIDQGIQSLVSEALSKIQDVHNGRWCLDRWVTSQPEHTPLPWTPISGSPQSTIMPPLILSAHLNQVSSYDEIHDQLVWNPTNGPTVLKVEKAKFIIPPLCYFLPSRVEHSQSVFAHMATNLLPSTPSCNVGEFDFMLLDPPWPNRSVRRSKSYMTSESQSADPWTSVSRFLNRHLAISGLIGVWITNKPSIRNEVLKTFREWKVLLIEAWVWVKTTAAGEPILPLDGIWRKPYEILLLGRKMEVVPVQWPSLSPFPAEVCMRVIAAVPDLHSRKPCVKELIETYFQYKQYRALEVFARNLTEGWWSWGDEVLKFNLEHNWETVDS
jgi:N6-adenosine-specific RNA methylase IME4